MMQFSDHEDQYFWIKLQKKFWNFKTCQTVYFNFECFVEHTNQMVFDMEMLSHCNKEFINLLCGEILKIDLHPQQAGADTKQDEADDFNKSEINSNQFI